MCPLTLVNANCCDKYPKRLPSPPQENPHSQNFNFRGGRYMFCSCFQMGWGFHKTFYVSLSEASARSASPHSLGPLKKPVALFAKAEDRPTAVASFFSAGTFFLLFFSSAWHSSRGNVVLLSPYATNAG